MNLKRKGGGIKIWVVLWGFFLLFYPFYFIKYVFAYVYVCIYACIQTRFIFVHIYLGIVFENKHV